MEKPRYTKNFYVARIKHLTRTLDTYSKYKLVDEIWIRFEKGKNRYRLALVINNVECDFQRGEEYELVYDRLDAISKVNDEYEIFKAINSSLSKARQRKSVLNAFKKLISEYSTSTYDGKKFNNFFEQDQELMFQKINTILPLDELPSNYTTKYFEQFKTNFAKKLYSLIYHQLLYQNLDSVPNLEHSKTTQKENIENFVAKKLKSIKKYIDYVHRVNYSDDIQLNAEKELLIYAIENYHDREGKTFGFYDPHSYPLEYLENELEELNYKIENDKEHNGHNENKEEAYQEERKWIINQNLQIEKKIGLFLIDYEKLAKYLIDNDKNFTKNAIRRYITLVENKTISARKNSGAKRKNKIDTIKNDYGDLYKFDENSIYYFQIKMIKTNNFIRQYKSQNELLKKYYYIELNITDKEWKYHPVSNFKSKQEYIEYLQIMEERDEMELEMNEYFYNEKNKS